MRRSILSVVLAVSSAALLASAPAIGSDKKQRAEPSAGRPKEVRRSVFSGNETRLRQGEIKSTERATVSIMPDGLLNSLSREEIRDLLAYLQKLK